MNVDWQSAPELVPDGIATLFAHELYAQFGEAAALFIGGQVFGCMVNQEWQKEIFWRRLMAAVQQLMVTESLSLTVH